jgi:hypothetical protein
MCVALMCAFVLDNVIPGTPAERGLTHWSALAVASTPVTPLAAASGRIGGGGGRAGNDADDSDSNSDDEADPALDPRNDPRIKAVYDLPYILQTLNERYILPYRLAAYRTMRRLSRAVRRRCRRVLRSAPVNPPTPKLGGLIGRTNGRAGWRRQQEPRALTKGLHHNSSLRIPGASATAAAADAQAGGSTDGAAGPYCDMADRPCFVIDEETGPTMPPRTKSAVIRSGDSDVAASGNGGGLFPGAGVASGSGVFAGRGGGGGGSGGGTFVTAAASGGPGASGGSGTMHASGGLREVWP